MKNPTVLMRQTNIAHGHQQVNNFPEQQLGENELMETTDGERLDEGTPSKAIIDDQTLETVGAKHRAKDK